MMFATALINLLSLTQPPCYFQAVLQTADASPLCVAVVDGDEHKVREMIRTGFDVNTTDAFGFSPILYAASGDDAEIVNLLLDSGATLNQISTDGTTILHALALANQIHPRLSAAITNVNEFINKSNVRGETPLAIACRNGSLPVTEWLIKKGADLSRRVAEGSCEGMSPLMIACVTGHANIVKLLLQYGALVDDRDKNGNTPLHLIAGSTFVDCADVLLQAKIDVNLKNLNGDSALHIAANSGASVAMCATLLTFGSDPDLSNKSGMTPLILAVSRGSEPIVILLLQHGADVDLADDMRRTAIMHGCRAVDYPTKYLVLNEMRRQWSNEDLDPWLKEIHRDSLETSEKNFRAEIDERSRCIGELLARTRTIDAVDESGDTALHYASRYCTIEIIRVLIANGAAPCRRNAISKSPIDIAKARDDDGGPAIVELLRGLCR